MRSDIAPGGVFPDYQLPDHTGKLCKLSELQGDDPLAPSSARGHYRRKAPAAFGTRRLLPEDCGVVTLRSATNRHRRSPYSAGIPCA